MSDLKRSSGVWTHDDLSNNCHLLWAIHTERNVLTVTPHRNRVNSVPHNGLMPSWILYMVMARTYTFTLTYISDKMYIMTISFPHVGTPNQIGLGVSWDAVYQNMFSLGIGNNQKDITRKPKFGSFFNILLPVSISRGGWSYAQLWREHEMDGNLRIENTSLVNKTIRSSGIGKMENGEGNLSSNRYQNIGKAVAE